MFQGLVYKRWGMSQTRQKSSSSERGHSSKGASKLQSEVNGVKPRRRVKGRQEGFSEELLFKQTLTEGREEASQVSGGKARQAGGRACAKAEAGMCS